MKVRTVLVGLGLAGIAFAATRLKTHSSQTRQVAVALVDSLSEPGARAEILRFSDPRRPDVVLLARESAGPSDLAAAIATYCAAEARRAGRLGPADRILLTRRSASPPATDRHRARAAEMLARVRREAPVRLGHYGRGRWRLFAVRVPV